MILSQLGAMIERDLEFPEGTMVTLVDVDVSRNLGEAAVKFSVFPLSKKEEAERILNNYRHQLQAELFKKINIFSLPKIVFIFDEGTVKSSQIEKIGLSDNFVDKSKPSM